MLTAIKGPVIYWTGNKETSTLKMIGENVNMIFAGTEGSIFISASTFHQNQILIYNSSFTNVFASYGSAILLKNIGKLFVDNCTFN